MYLSSEYIFHTECFYEYTLDIRKKKIVDRKEKHGKCKFIHLNEGNIFHIICQLFVLKA